MVRALMQPTQWGVDIQGNDIAAIVLRLDGLSTVWRAPGLEDDVDVTAWSASALNAQHPDYASLFWRDLLSLRANHVG